MADEIALTDAARRALLVAAREAAPRECAAVLGGARGARRTAVTDVLPVPNVAARDDRFEVSPESFFTAEQELARRGREFVGFAHSHPRGACAPSSRDRETLWSGCVQLITDGEVVRAFRIDGERTVHPLPLCAAEVLP